MISGLGPQCLTRVGAAEWIQSCCSSSGGSEWNLESTQTDWWHQLPVHVQEEERGFSSPDAFQLESCRTLCACLDVTAADSVIRNADVLQTREKVAYFGSFLCRNKADFKDTQSALMTSWFTRHRLCWRTARSSHLNCSSSDKTCSTQTRHVCLWKHDQAKNNAVLSFSSPTSSSSP